MFMLAPVKWPGGPDWEQSQPVGPVQLTDIQRRIYDYVRWYQMMWGASPLYREIAEACGLKGDSAVQYQIQKLVKLGLMYKPPGLVRAIRLTGVPVKPA
jgi:SOS-response transcriptional repressor LexA